MYLILIFVLFIYRINKLYRKVIIAGALKYIQCTPVRSDIITQFSLNILKMCLLCSLSLSAIICTKGVEAFIQGQQHQECWKGHVDHANPVFSSNDLMLSFYIIYLCFILDLRRESSTHNCAFFKL